MLWKRSDECESVCTATMRLGISIVLDISRWRVSLSDSAAYGTENKLRDARRQAVRRADQPLASMLHFKLHRGDRSGCGSDFTPLVVTCLFKNGNSASSS